MTLFAAWWEKSSTFFPIFGRATVTQSSLVLYFYRVTKPNRIWAVSHLRRITSLRTSSLWMGRLTDDISLRLTFYQLHLMFQRSDLIEYL